MSSTLPRIDVPGDAELISAVRGGDLDAYGDLFERHVEAARRLARQLVPAGDVDDLVSDAFAKVLNVLQRGGGPDVAFRAYLLTAVRSLRVDRLRASSKVQPTDDLESFDPGVPFRDTAVEGFENAAAARAFASLPERWQLVLWHTEVEGQKPAEVAALLGMTANSVSALAYRAREGLRQAFLNEHVQDLEADECRWVHEHLGAYVRNGVSRRDGAKVEQHLSDCRKCMAIYLELTEVNSNLSGILAPLLLGGFAAAYVVSGTSTAAAAGGIAALFDRAKDFASANTGTAVAAGIATVALTAGLGFAAVQVIRPDKQPAVEATTSADTGDAPPGAAAEPAAPSSPAKPPKKAKRTKQPPQAPPSNAAAAPVVAPSIAPPDTLPSPAPDAGPNPGPDSGPGQTKAPGDAGPGKPDPGKSDPKSDPKPDPKNGPKAGPKSTGPTGTPAAATAPAAAAPVLAPTPSAVASASDPAPSPSLDNSPSPSLSTTPSKAPSDTPTATVTPTATPTVPTLPVADLAVSFRNLAIGTSYVYIDIRVDNLPAGAQATVKISGSNVPGLTSLSDSCSGSGELSCVVSAVDPIVVLSFENKPGVSKLNVSVSSTAVSDPNSANNAIPIVINK